MSGSFEDIVLSEQWIDNYYRGPNCRTDRCQYYRRKDSEGGPWCWLKAGIGSEGMSPQCPAYRHHIRTLKSSPRS